MGVQNMEILVDVAVGIVDAQQAPACATGFFRKHVKTVFPNMPAQV